MSTAKPAVKVPAVSHAIRILRHLAHAEPQGVTAIARRLEISPSSCFNLLKTLAAEGMVEFDPVGKTYRLGTGIGEISRAPEQALVIARPRLEAIAARHQVACGLWSFSGGRLVLMAFAESELATRIHMTLGQRLPAYIGAMGRCVAAHASIEPAALESEFKRLRWWRPPTLGRYLAEVAQVRRRGWALDDGDFMPGITTIGAPIVDGTGAVRHCIATTMFQGQATVKSIRDIGRDTALAANGIARALYGAQGGGARSGRPQAAANH